MKKEKMISAKEFCLYHNIDLAFIHSLKESGLIDVVSIKMEAFIEESQLRHLENLMRLKQEMDINMEGIETITYLLRRINVMQIHIVQLNNRLKFYEL
jgi:hypothetical protein